MRTIRTISVIASAVVLMTFASACTDDTETTAPASTLRRRRPHRRPHPRPLHRRLPRRTSSTRPPPRTSTPSSQRFRQRARGDAPGLRAVHGLRTDRRCVREGAEVPDRQAAHRAVQDRARAHPQVPRDLRLGEGGRHSRQDVEPTTLLGAKLAIDGNGGKVVINGGVNVTTPDVQASNGTIHIIGDVLLPTSRTPPWVTTTARPPSRRSSPRSPPASSPRRSAAAAPSPSSPLRTRRSRRSEGNARQPVASGEQGAAPDHSQVPRRLGQRRLREGCRRRYGQHAQRPSEPHHHGLGRRDQRWGWQGKDHPHRSPRKQRRDTRDRRRPPATWLITRARA